MAYHFHFEVIDRYLLPFLHAGRVTLTVAGLCIGIGTLLGLLVGALRASRSRILRGVCTVYVEAFRLTPFMVQLLFAYLALPLIVPFRITPIAAAVLTLSLNASAYASEVFRAGIQSVPQTQMAAGLALGMTRIQVFRRIIIPQGVRVVFPAYLSLMIQVMKDTSIFSIIAVPEITGYTKYLASQTFRSFELYTILALFYFAVTLTLGQLGRVIETRVLKTQFK